MGVSVHIYQPGWCWLDWAWQGFPLKQGDHLFVGLLAANKAPANLVSHWFICYLFFFHTKGPRRHAERRWRFPRRGRCRFWGARAGWSSTTPPTEGKRGPSRKDTKKAVKRPPSWSRADHQKTLETVLVRLQPDFIFIFIFVRRDGENSAVTINLMFRISKESGFRCSVRCMWIINVHLLLSMMCLLQANKKKNEREITQ